MKKRILSLMCAVLVLGGVVAIYAASQTGVTPPTLVSETAVLIDGDTGQVLFDKDMHRKMNPASITKVMTALLALEEGKPEDVIKMSHDAVFSISSDASKLSLDVDEEITMEQALYAMATISANDAANGIAEAVGGTMAAFAEKMTSRARELGALNTTFKNANGLTEEGHMTTAYDMALIMMEAVKSPEFCKYFSTLTYKVPPTNKAEERPLSNRNGMLSGEYASEYAIAGKTGITTAAGHTMVTAFRRDGRTLIAVVLKTTDIKDKYVDSLALMNYGFDAFSPVTLTKAELDRTGYLINDVEGRQQEVDLTAAGDVTFQLLNTLARTDVAVEYAVEGESATATVTLKDPFKDRMAQPLLVIPLTVGSPAGEEEAPAAGDADVTEKEGSSIGKIFLTVLAVLLGLCALAFLGLFIMRQVNLRRRRKRRNRRRR